MNPMHHTLELEGLENGWKGHLVLEAPLHTERLKVISQKKLHKLEGTGKKKGGGVDLDAVFDQQLPMLVDIYENHARKLIQEVAIVGPNGQKIDSVEDFDRHPATAQCFMEVATAYMMGFGPGKKKN